MDKKLHLYYFSGTHWDREWYQSFQGFRYKLVKMFNDMIEYMENYPEFKVFHMDGQTILLEDYMDIMPQNRARLQKLIDDGRLLIGPWYVMPDEFLLSGESLIANLYRGHRIANDWNTPSWNLGYICDIFGHIAQMPQIFSGFNIPYALLARGINEDRSTAFFRWVSPDDSECITFNVPEDGGYGAFSSRVLGYEDAGFVKTDNYSSKIKSYFEAEQNRTNLPFIIAMDAHDHQFVHKETAKVMDVIKSTFPECDVHHENLSNLFDNIKSSFYGELRIIKGELNETLKADKTMVLISNTLSSRYPLKKANDICQTLLEKTVNPLLAASSITSNNISAKYLQTAYTHLLQNHPHDSICGCSIDQVHKDMEYRFDQVKMIASELINDCLEYENTNIPLTINNASNLNAKAGADGVLAGIADFSIGSENMVLSLYNTLPYERSELVFVDIAFEIDYPNRFMNGFGYQFINSFKIYDTASTEIPYQVTEIKKDWTVRLSSQMTKKMDLYTVAFHCSLVPLGRTFYHVVAFKGNSRYLSSRKLALNEAENRFIHLKIEKDGTISVIDKISGNGYKNLLNFIDDGDIGDGWYHCNSAQDFAVIGENCVSIERIHSGACLVQFKISKQLKVPVEMSYTAHQTNRSDKYTMLNIDTIVTLGENERFVRIKTTIDNNARDHRLRMIFPTGITTDTYFSNQAFCFNERKTGIDISTATWREVDVHEKQMASIVGKRDASGNGLAISSDYGLHECAAYDDNEGTIAITLLRAFRKTVFTNDEDGGQIIGKHTYEFTITPFQASTSYAYLQKQNDLSSSAILCRQLKSSLNVGDIANESHFSLVGENICYSILKPHEFGANADDGANFDKYSENKVVLRVYNCSDSNATGKFLTNKKIMNVAHSNLLEIKPQNVPFKDNSFEISLSKWKIATFILTLNSVN